LGEEARMLRQNRSNPKDHCRKEPGSFSADKKILSRELDADWSFTAPCEVGGYRGVILRLRKLKKFDCPRRWHKHHEESDKIEKADERGKRPRIKQGHWKMAIAP